MSTDFNVFGEGNGNFIFSAFDNPSEKQDASSDRLSFVSKFPAKTSPLLSNKTRRKMSCILWFTVDHYLCIFANNAVVYTKFVGPFSGYEATKTATSSSADDSFVSHCFVHFSSWSRSSVIQFACSVTRSNLDPNLWLITMLKKLWCCSFYLIMFQTCRCLIVSVPFLIQW